MEKIETTISSKEKTGKSLEVVRECINELKEIGTTRQTTLPVNFVGLEGFGLKLSLVVTTDRIYKSNLTFPALLYNNATGRKVGKPVQLQFEGITIKP